MNTAATLHRTPLVISAGGLTVGPVHASFLDGNRESLLHSYLVLVRRMRGQLREPTITLRNADISALAEHLGASEEIVLDDLLDRMGASRAQRKALLAMFAVGALSIVATGSVALELSADALGEGSNEPVPVAEAVSTAQIAEPSAPAANATGAANAVDRTVESTTDAAAAAAPAATTAAAATATTSATTTTDAPDAELAIAVGGDDWEYTLSLHQLANALATDPPVPIRVAGAGVADDGSTVAVAEPPVPPAEGIGVADDGSVVGVAPPPVP